MRLISPLLVTFASTFLGRAVLDAQAIWQPLVTIRQQPLDSIHQTRIWADSASWTRTSENSWSIRLRIVEGRVDGKASAHGTILTMEINCAQGSYRVRQTSLERRDTAVEPLPDSLGTSTWARPHEGWQEDYIVRAVCANPPQRS